MCNFEIIWYKTYFDLKAEVARGSLGVLWLVLEPLLYLGALSVVFIAIRQRTDEGFLAFLFVGLVVWKWFAMSVSQGSNSIVGHAGLMRQVYIPKTFFPLVSLGVNFVKFFIVFCLLMTALLALGFEANLTWLSLPALLMIQLLFLASVTFTISWSVCYIPDIKMVVDNSLLFLFFLSGILFDISKAPDYIRDYLYLNPVLIIIDSFRTVLLKGEWPNWSPLLIVVLGSLLLLLLSIRLLHKHDRKIPKVVLR
jgi:lipopolysaccharide transport system permease protein